ncbi:9992_t:CDS:1, partial [Scutellospora calospora]
KLEHNEVIYHTTFLRNQFRIAFSVSKTAINIALETNSNKELIQILKNFIIVKQQAYKDSSRCNSNNSCDNTNENNITNELDEIVPLQQQLINQITDPKVVKICNTLSKKRMKSFTEILDKRVNNQEINNSETSSR